MRNLDIYIYFFSNIVRTKFVLFYEEAIGLEELLASESVWKGFNYIFFLKKKKELLWGEKIDLQVLIKLQTN